MTETDFSLDRNAFGRLVLTTADGTVHENVVPVRAFPIAAPDDGLSLLSHDGKELVWISRPSALPAAPRPEEVPTPSLANATISQAEVDQVVTGSIAKHRTDETPSPVMAYAAAPAPSVPTPVVAARTGWLVQIGAYDQEGKARAALADAKSKGGAPLASAQGFTETVGGASSGLWRARFAGFHDQAAADGACKALKRKNYSCLALRQ